MLISLLQSALMLLLAVQHSPAVTEATRAQVLAVARAVVQYAHTPPQALGVIASPSDGTVWHAATEPLPVAWQKALPGDARSWNPISIRIDLEGKFDGMHPEERPVSPAVVWSGNLSGRVTLQAQNIHPGGYRLFVVGLTNPDSGIGAWAMTPPVDIAVE